MRSGFVFTTILLALALGAVAGASESRLLTRAFVIGFVPAIWALWHAVEWLTGRGLWHFTAPNPSGRPGDDALTVSPPRAVAPAHDDTPDKLDDAADRHAFPFAA